MIYNYFLHFEFLDEYNPGSYWADDNCINHRTRDCLAKFFKGSNENDVLIFTLGGSYMLDSDEEEMQKERTSTGDVIGFDKRAWLISSMLNFKAHIAAVFKGQVFRVTLAPTNKNGNIASYTPKLKEAERVMAEVLQTESVEPSHMWYTIDQWAINEGRDYLYQDHIHFNGPLTLATLHCMLNELCPGGGNKDLPNYWPSPHLQNQIITSSSLTSSSHYYIDTLGYRHSIELGPGQHPGTIPWFLLDKPIIKLPEKEIENISESNAPVPYIKEECLIRPTNNKQVYWVKDGVKRGFPSGDIFIAHGFNFGDIIVYDPWIVDLIPLGEDVKY